MKRRLSWIWFAQVVVVLVCVFTVKLFYSSAGANQLRWILAPTAACVELVSGTSFEFESYAGYLSEDRTFLIAPSCAGVNFLITAFLMLTGRNLFSGRSKGLAWGFIPTAAVIAFLVTIAANTTRISIALQMRGMTSDGSWFDANQVHRFEGIFIYFVFLLLLFELSEYMSSERSSSLVRHSLFPLLVYYAVMLGVPLANGAYRRGSDFWEHTLFVLLIPLTLILPVAAFRWRILRTDMLSHKET